MTSRTERVRGVHNIVMCDVGGEGERLRDVTHVTSAAGSGQKVVDDSTSTQDIISTYQNFDIIMLTVANVPIHKKIVLCLKLI